MSEGPSEGAERLRKTARMFGINSSHWWATLADVMSREDAHRLALQLAEGSSCIYEYRKPELVCPNGVDFTICVTDTTEQRIVLACADHLVTVLAQLHHDYKGAYIVTFSGWKR